MSHETIGDRVREFREIKRLTREELAGRSGLDEEFIAGSVLADPIVVRVAERERSLEDEIPSIRETAGDLAFFPLGKGKIDRHMEPFFIDVLPQPPGQVKVSQHAGEEFIVVMSGEIELQYGEETFRLGPGDSVYYGSDTPHRLVALNDQEARIIAVIYFNA